MPEHTLTDQRPNLMLHQLRLTVVPEAAGKALDQPERPVGRRFGFHDHGDHLQLVISDNGAGFAADEMRGGGHLGLANMHARATDLGGRLQIESELGVGTRIIAWLPFTPPDAAQQPRIE